MSTTAGRFAALVCAAFVVTAFTGCGRDASPQQYLQEAKAFQTKHDYKAAVIQLKNALAHASFEKALVLQSDYVPAASHLAQQDMMEKDPEAARRHFLKVLEKDPGSAQAVLALADLAALAGDEQAQVGWLEKVVKAERTAIDHYWFVLEKKPDNLAVLYQERKDLRALALAERA